MGQAQLPETQSPPPGGQPSSWWKESTGAYVEDKQPGPLKKEMNQLPKRAESSDTSHSMDEM